MGDKMDVTGFQAIISPNGSHCSRAFWAVALVASISGLVFHCLGVFWKYNYEPDIGVKITQKPMRDIPFPAVTICSPVFAKDHIVSYRLFGTTGRNLTTKQKNYFAANYQACNPTDEIGDFEFLKEFLRDRTDFDILRLVNESSLSIHEAMLFCNGRHIPVACDSIFTRMLTFKGFCFTTNMQDTSVVYNDIISDSFKGVHSRVSEKNSIWSLDKGYAKNHTDDEIPLRARKSNRLNIMLNLEQKNAENFCPTHGKIFTVIFHLPSEVPTMFHQEFYVHYNSGRSFVLTATSYRANRELRSYPPSTRGCYFQDERKLKFFKSYTKSQCDYECITNYTLVSCGCVKFSMPHETGTPLCDMDQMKCVAHAMERWPVEIDGNRIACNCLQTCNDIAYGFKFDRETSIDFTEDFLGSDLRPPNSTDVAVLLNFVDHLVMEHRKFIAYQFENFIADMGGLLGLFLGCSLISFVELFYTITNILIAKRKQFSRVKDDAEVASTKANNMHLANIHLRSALRELAWRIQRLEEKASGGAKN